MVAPPSNACWLPLVRATGVAGLKLTPAASKVGAKLLPPKYHLLFDFDTGIVSPLHTFSEMAFVKKQPVLLVPLSVTTYGLGCR